MLYLLCDASFSDTSMHLCILHRRIIVTLFLLILGLLLNTLLSSTETVTNPISTLLLLCLFLLLTSLAFCFQFLRGFSSE